MLAILAICLFIAAVLPPANRRTIETDALEFALVTLLTTMFSPLSFNYAYVWLLYPTTLALHRVLSEPRGARWHGLKVAWIGGVLLIPAFAIPYAAGCSGLRQSLRAGFALGSGIRTDPVRDKPAFAGASRRVGSTRVAR